MSSDFRTKDLLAVHYLRGLACLGVVVFHVRVDLWVGWGALRSSETATGWDRAVAWLCVPTPFFGSGVMLFFLLSGFCIGLPYMGEQGRPFKFKEYIIRRFLRIYPPYLAVIALCWLVEKVIAMHGGPPMSPIDAYKMSALMVQNYTTGQVVSNPSLWSLPVEMELYLVFPLVYLGLRRLGAGWVMGLTGGVSVMALAGYYAGLRWLGLDFAKFWVLWSAGVVMAEWYAAGRLLQPSRWIFLLGGCALGAAVIGELRGVDAAVLHFFYGTFYFVVLWWAVANDGLWRRLPRGVASGLKVLGTVSYSLYLVHFPFFRLCGAWWLREQGGKPVNFIIPLMFVVSAVGIRWIFFRLIEAPSHQLAKTVARKWGKLN